MIDNEDDSYYDIEPQEIRKRRREIYTILGVGIVFLLLTWVEFQLFGFSQSLPFVHSIFFFGLVNFNIILLLLLLFLIFRNVVKVFAERRGKVIGSSLKGKLIAAFVTFSFVPTLLMFFISVFYINNSFDKWFSVKMAGVLKSSLEVTNEYYVSAKKKNYHFAYQITEDLKKKGLEKDTQKRLEKFRSLFRLDSIEYYPSLLGDRTVVLDQRGNLPEVPPVSLEFLQKGIRQKVEASTIHQFSQGNLVRVIVPVTGEGLKGAIVVSSFVPLSILSKMNDIAAAYEDFRDLNPLEYPIKSIYLIILILMTMVILLGATWFGFHLAKQLSIPLVLLGRAAKRVSTGDYRPVKVNSGSEEIGRLVESFNEMTIDLSQSEKEIRIAHQSLKETLSSLDEHSRYLEVVLSGINTGVISVDRSGVITTLNRHASQLLKVNAESVTNKQVHDLLKSGTNFALSELLQMIEQHQIGTLQKEIRLTVEGEAIPIQLTLSVLKDDQGEEKGKVLVFADLTMLQNAQRAAAWRDVARRIAHEIKNPLTPIRLSAQRLQRKFGQRIDDPAFASCTTMIIKQTDDLKSLVNEFSHFARMPQVRPVLSSLNQMIEESLVLYQTAHKRIFFHFLKDEKLPDFKFDPDQLKRVLSNLLDNAVAAIKGQKRRKIEISTQYDHLLKIVRLTISDTGAGIPAHLRARIFEPYFSTKEGGTGLGLAIVKRIIEDHSGFIRAFEHPPTGTRVVIELPVMEMKSWKENQIKGSKRDGNSSEEQSHSHIDY